MRGDDARVTIEQALPRRVRLSAARLAWQREACAHVARALAEGSAVTRVTARPATGSVIVEGEEGTLAPEALRARLAELVSAERDAEGRPLSATPAARPEDQPGPTRIARAVAHAVAGINADVRDALDQRADLGTVLPVFFAVAGLVEVGTTGRMPVPTWFNLLWWSLRSFMTFNLRAVEEEVGGPPLDDASLHGVAAGI